MTDTKLKTVALARRDVLKAAGIGALALAGTAMVQRKAMATPQDAAAALEQLTNGASKTAKEGKVSLDLPELAENGSTVPTTIKVESPMTDQDYVKEIHVVSEGNPFPDVASFHLTPALGKAEIMTRIRLGATQDVVAVAIMSNGQAFIGRKNVKVTVGGCGG